MTTRLKKKTPNNCARMEQQYLDIPVSDVHAVEVFYGRTDVVHYL